MTQTWQPSATIERLKARANLLTTIRQFFSERAVLEVDTPSLSQASVTDIHLHTFQTEFDSPQAPQPQKLYLMTSPEFHMKRLLCAGSGPIFQLSKAFRNEEQGRFHNPEFTLLEWYRPGFDHHQLMDEMEQFLQMTLHCLGCSRQTYQQAFLQQLGVDPLTASLTEIKAVAPASCADLACQESDRDTLLQLLFSEGVEPYIGIEQPTFIYNFPASQAALARLCPNDDRVAERFEVYFKGIELANGFHELTDAQEQRERFEADNDKRQQMGQLKMPIDDHLLQALEQGLPKCAGVALGIDRLLMLQQGVHRIEDVLSFAVNRA